MKKDGDAASQIAVAFAAAPRHAAPRRNLKRNQIFTIASKQRLSPLASRRIYISTVDYRVVQVRFLAKINLSKSSSFTSPPQDKRLTSLRFRAHHQTEARRDGSLRGVEGRKQSVRTSKRRVYTCHTYVDVDVAYTDLYVKRNRLIKR